MKAVLVEALELPAAEREAFLATACGHDLQLRAEVASLLEYEPDADFLEPPSVDVPEEDDDPQPVEPDNDPLVGSTLGHYRILERIGAGGMGVVYTAADLRLGRRVALKFLRRDLSFDEELKARLIREARAIASLDHPNICTLYGIDHTADERMFLAMAYYEGQTLKQRLAAGRLPLSASLDIARQIGSGLAAAHAAGIVHRDLKPGNVMLIGPLVKILDFGIAKLTDQTPLTIHGASLGTAAYMSPEQAEGAAVDHRTDIWALGVVLFEMVTGRRPFEVDSFTRLGPATAPPDLRPRLLRADMPPALETCLLRALAVKPADRYPSMPEFVAALEDAQQHVHDPVPVVVVPAPAASGDEVLLNDVVCEALADVLSMVAGLTVVVHPHDMLTDSRVKHAGSGPAVPAATAPRVVVGATLSHGGAMRVVATSMEAGGRAIDEWKGQEDVSGLPKLLNWIARAVIGSLRVSASVGEQQQLASTRSVLADCYLPYLKGRWYVSQRTESSCGTALALFEQASTADPLDPLARAGIVEACLGLMETGCAADRDALAKRADNELKRALELDSTAPDVQFAAAEASYRLQWSFADAEERLRRLLKTCPGHWRARLRLAECLLVSGKFAEAAGLAVGVAERRPGSPGALLRVGRVLHLTRDYGGALRVFEAAVTRAPNLAVAHLDLALTCAKNFDPARARAACDRALALHEGQALMIAVLGNSARARGNAAEHASATRALRELDQESPVSPCCFKLLEAAFGDTDRPLEYWDGYDETVGLAKFCGFTPVQGSLSMFLDSVGLIAYFGLDPSFDSLCQAPSVLGLLATLHHQSD